MGQSYSVQEEPQGSAVALLVVREGSLEEETFKLCLGRCYD